MTAATGDVFVANDVRTLIAIHLGVDVKRVTDEARFTNDLGADWLDCLELMILIEDQFDGVEMTDDDVDQIAVVGDLIRHIESATNERRRRGAAPVIRKLFGPCLARAVKPAKHQICEGSEQRAGASVGSQGRNLQIPSPVGMQVVSSLTCLSCHFRNQGI